MSFSSLVGNKTSTDTGLSHTLRGVMGIGCSDTGTYHTKQVTTGTTWFPAYFFNINRSTRNKVEGQAMDHPTRHNNHPATTKQPLHESNSPLSPCHLTLDHRDDALTSAVSFSSCLNASAASSCSFLRLSSSAFRRGATLKAKEAGDVIYAEARCAVRLSYHPAARKMCNTRNSDKPLLTSPCPSLLNDSL